MSKKLILALGLVVAIAGAAQTNSHDRAEMSNSSSAQPATENAAAGKAVFSGAGNCLSCHRVGATGSAMGPNLSDVGSRLSADEMNHQLMDPPASIDARNRLCEIVLANGQRVRGKLLNQDEYSVQLLNSDGELVAYPRAELHEMHAVDPPHMPSYKTSLSPQQIDNLIAYLQSLRMPVN